MTLLPLILLSLPLQFLLALPSPFLPIPSHPSIKFPPKVPRNRLQMHKVAETSPSALPHLVLPATRLPEVSDRTQLSINRPSTKPSAVQIIRSSFCFSFVFELDVNISYQVVTKIIAHIHLFYLTIFILTLYKHFLEEVVIVLLHLLVGHGLASHVTAVCCFGGILWIDVKILEDNGLTESWFVVNSAATISVSASSYFEIKAAVHLILLSAKDGSKVLGHVGLIYLYS